MKTEVADIEQSLQNLLKAQVPPLKVRESAGKGFEVAGPKEVMQGRRKVDGIYFASVVPKPKDCRFYFFPIYTHKDEMPALSPELQKALKGKSCFHIRKLSPEMENELGNLIQRGVDVYRENDLI